MALPERSQRVAIAVISALIGSVFAVVLTDGASVSAVRTGDFPAFYSMAVIADSDQPQRLYDQELQGSIQASLWREHLSQAVLPGAYPPYVAFVLRPLAWLGPVIGRAVWTLLSICCLLLAVLKAAELSPDLRAKRWEVTAAALSFMPLLVGTMGGQLVAVSAAVYVALLWLAFDNECIDSRSQRKLGVLAGMWLFKPQYALVVLLLLVLTRRWSAVVGFAVVSSICYLLGACVMGLSWPHEWLAFAGQFAEMNFSSNSHQMTNLIGAARQLIRLGLVSSRSKETLMVASALSAVVVVSWLMWSRRRSLYVSLLMLAPVLVVCTPQANFYDLGLCFFPLVLLFNPREFGDRWLLLSIWFLAAIAAAVRTQGQMPWFALLACGVLTVIASRIFVSCYATFAKRAAQSESITRLP